MTIEELLTEAITPNKGAAGVKIGAKMQAVKDLWGEPVEVEQINDELIRWAYKQAWFWFKAGKLNQIALYNGYQGKTKRGIGIGSLRSVIEDQQGPLEWDGCWMVNNPPFGIGFEFSSPHVGKPVVTEIYIFRE